MLLTNRRHRMLFLALAGLEISWFVPYLALMLAFWSPRSPYTGFDHLVVLTSRPVIAIGVIWGITVFYMLIADWLNQRRIDAPLRQLVILASLLFTTILLVLILVYPQAQWLSGVWLPAMAAALFNFTTGLRPELVLLLLNFYLWFRVAAFTDRDIGFFSVGLSFRLAMLLALLANGLLTTLGGQPPIIGIQYFTLTIAFGLVAAALARVDDKALGARNSSGALMPWARLFHIALAAAAAIVLAFLLAALLSPDNLRTFFSWFAPLGQLLGWILTRVAIAFFILISPLFEWLAGLIQDRALEIPPAAPLEPLPDDLEYLGLGEAIQRWALLRYCLVTGIIALAIGLLWLFFVRTQQRPRPDEDEDATTEEANRAEDGLPFGLGRLAAWLKLLRRYGLGAQLLAAVSVENIYANVLRIARRKGYPRPPAQPPDRFLSTLEQAFPGHQAALRRITDAYMRVYYGSRTLEPAELQQIKADYHALRTDAPLDSSTGASGPPSSSPSSTPPSSGPPTA